MKSITLKRLLYLLFIAVLAFSLTGCKSQEVKDVEKAIENISEVTLNSGDDIINAYELYDKLTEEDVKVVSNYEVLETAYENYKNTIVELLKQYVKDSSSAENIDEIYEKLLVLDPESNEEVTQDLGAAVEIEKIYDEWEDFQGIYDVYGDIALDYFSDFTNAVTYVNKSGVARAVKGYSSEIAKLSYDGDSEKAKEYVKILKNIKENMQSFYDGIIQQNEKLLDNSIVAVKKEIDNMAEILEQNAERSEKQLKLLSQLAKYEEK